MPEGHEGDPLLAEVVLSDSHQLVIEAACSSGTSEVQQDGTQQWVTLQPERFSQIIQDSEASTDELEMRLQINHVCASSRSTSPRRNGPDTSPLPESSSSASHISSGTNLGPPPTAEGGNNTLPANSRRLERSLSNLSRKLPLPLLSQASNMNSFVMIKSPTRRKSASSTDQAHIMFNDGLTAFLSGKHADARNSFSKAAAEFYNLGDRRIEADCLRRIGISYRHLHDYVAARSYLRAALALYESIGTECRGDQLRCSRHLACVDVDSGNYQLAASAYQQILETAEREGLASQRAWCLCYIGHMYNQMQQYEEAFSVLKAVINDPQEVRSLDIEGFAIEESGYARECQGRSDLAMTLYKKALETYQTGGGGKWIENEDRVKGRMTKLKKEMNIPSRLRSWSLTRPFGH
ncbi:hypothetical protein RhiLY_05010 [Ceratobasidium sp. AG-Ba]|nr:hypothetical protein RhiLY_05010 [Ceratobasidium sp. AG-Ba]